MSHGCHASMELILEALFWAARIRRPLTAADIIARWDVSRATAYRWLGPLENARRRLQEMQGHGGQTQ